MPVPIRTTGSSVDLSSRFFQSKTVAASPALAAETIIATLTCSGDVGVVSGVWLTGFAAFTVGTSGTAVNLRIRADNVAGTVIAATGATTGGIAATNIVDVNVAGFDTNTALVGAGLQAQVYVLTLQVTAGSAASTVSAVQLAAFVI